MPPLWENRISVTVTAIIPGLRPVILRTPALIDGKHIGEGLQVVAMGYCRADRVSELGLKTTKVSVMLKVTSRITAEVRRY